jgi:hypothetical protein
MKVKPLCWLTTEIPLDGGFKIISDDPQFMQNEGKKQGTAISENVTDN